MINENYSLLKDKCKKIRKILKRFDLNKTCLLCLSVGG